LKALIFAPILFLLVLFALSNPQIVHLTLWPTDVVVDLPLSITVLIAMAVSLLLGAFMLWISVLGARLRARRAESRLRQLQAEIEALRAQLVRASPPIMSLPEAAVTRSSVS